MTGTAGSPSRSLETPSGGSDEGKAMLRTILLVLPILAVFLFAVYYMIFAWNAGGDVEMHASGWVAMALGVVFSFALAAVLIVLLLRRDPEEPGSGQRPDRREPGSG